MKVSDELLRQPGVKSVGVNMDCVRSALAAGYKLIPVAESVTEKEFQRAVVKEAERMGWKVFHPWLSIKSTAGWPDLSMARSGRLILAELKTMTGTPSAAQLTWGELLREVKGIEYRLWRPCDWREIVETLA